jgi:hypothetical protein
MGARTPRARGAREGWARGFSGKALRFLADRTQNKQQQQQQQQKGKKGR